MFPSAKIGLPKHWYYQNGACFGLLSNRSWINNTDGISRNVTKQTEGWGGVPKVPITNPMAKTKGVPRITKAIYLKQLCRLNPDQPTMQSIQTMNNIWQILVSLRQFFYSIPQMAVCWIQFLESLLLQNNAGD